MRLSTKIQGLGRPMMKQKKDKQVLKVAFIAVKEK
jgi:hypothetical protein